MFWPDAWDPTLARSGSYPGGILAWSEDSGRPLIRLTIFDHQPPSPSGVRRGGRIILACRVLL